MGRVGYQGGPHHCCLSICSMVCSDMDGEEKTNRLKFARNNTFPAKQLLVPELRFPLAVRQVPEQSQEPHRHSLKNTNVDFMMSNS